MLFSLIENLAREAGWTPLWTLIVRAGIAGLTALGLLLQSAVISCVALL